MTTLLDRAKERGTNEQEITDVIETGSSIPSKYGRMGKAEIYKFERKRLTKHYEKRVEVFYTIEGIVTAICLCVLWKMGRMK